MVTSETEPAQPADLLVRCLSFHSTYGCQNTGICCSSGWDIAVERPIELDIIKRLGAKTVGSPRRVDGFRATDNPPIGCDSALRVDPDTGACWFRDHEARRCAIHREFGEAALPTACRHFPRVCILEPGQVSVSLTHYCPTAASLLFSAEPEFGLVDSPRAFPSNWPFEGLDARTSYSPLLRPGVLLGFDGLRRFEDGALRALSSGTVWDRLAQIDSAIENVRSWTPPDGFMTEAVDQAFVGPVASRSRAALASDPRMVLRASLPTGTNQKLDLPEILGVARPLRPEIDLALRKYVAARLVGCWITFMADDLRTTGRYLHLCLDAVLMFERARPVDEGESEAVRWMESIRSADLWLMHHCDPELIAANLR